ncbi:MAG: MFS transporter [Terrimicrobiaceae bacterium]|nr:MFS transporter [Terrimicrobiaceae bacterium]
MNSRSIFREVLQPAVLVGALGYFVDIYDLTLFGIVRVPSLTALGLAGEQLVNHGLWLLNVQMLGMLAGGIAFGILGDRKGRLHVLFGSILLYSLANLFNGAVTSLPAYYALRFIAGVGLAGEIGGSITLVSEVLSKETRGYGTTLVATVGVTGAIVGNFVAKTTDWRMAFYIGGGMGLALLVLRLSVAESGMFRALQRSGPAVARGRFLALFTDRRRFGKYARCILIGLPSWFVVGILALLSPEFGHALGVREPILAGNSVALVYVGLTFGDFASGLLSQWLRSRKRVVLGFVLLTLAGMIAYFCCRGVSAGFFYGVMFLLGVGIGYWAVFITIAAEQFGTNLRSTVATTVPNFVRASTTLITLAFQGLAMALGDRIPAAILVGVACIGIALWALAGLEETFGKDLDYIEPL